jgi:uncharacterized membrane protein
MKHVFYALFEDAWAASEALIALKALGVSEADYSVIVHKDAYEVEEGEDLKLVETDMREGLVEGVTLGGLAGAIGAAMIAGPPGLIGAGPLLAALAVGGLAGGVYGGMGSFLYSLGIPDRSLDELAERLRPGGVLVTVEAADDDLEKRIELLFERKGAIAREKHRV